MREQLRSPVRGGRIWPTAAALGAESSPFPPAPSPAGRGRRHKRGWEPLFPGLSPWATIFRPYRVWCNLHHESLGQDTSLEYNRSFPYSWYGALGSGICRRACAPLNSRRGEDGPRLHSRAPNWKRAPPLLLGYVSTRRPPCWPPAGRSGLPLPPHCGWWTFP